MSATAKSCTKILRDPCQPSVCALYFFSLHV